MKSFLLTLMASSFAIQGFSQKQTVTGSYTFDDEGVKGVKVWSSADRDRVSETDKRGRFKVKNVKVDSDTLFFEPYKGKAIVVPLEGKSIVKVQRRDSLVSVELAVPEKRPSGMYGGMILTQKDLSNTGANYALEAVYKRVPQRVITTFNGSIQPLYFLDGVEVNTLSGIPVIEVAYVEIVKATDAAASNWGSRGGNGAILFTTKGKYETTK